MIDSTASYRDVSLTVTSQRESNAMAEVTAQPDSKESDESRPKRGGRRPGAGRKPNLAKRLLRGFSRDAIAEAVAGVDCGAVIVGLLKSKREKTRLETLAFVRDTIIGRPAQNVNVAGGLLHAHAWRPLATLTDEEVQQLDAITKKLSAPVSNALPDAPQNQIESKPAIEAEVVESESPKGTLTGAGVSSDLTQIQPEDFGIDAQLRADASHH